MPHIQAMGMALGRDQLTWGLCLTQQAPLLARGMVQSASAYHYQVRCRHEQH